MSELVLVKSDVSKPPAKRISNHARLERERLLKEEIHRYHKAHAMHAIRLREMESICTLSEFVIREITNRLRAMAEAGATNGFGAGFESRMRIANEQFFSAVSRVAREWQEASERLEAATDEILPILMED